MSSVTKAPSGPNTDDLLPGDADTHSSTPTERKVYQTIMPKLPDNSQDEEIMTLRSRICRTVESLEWVNEIARACWPHIGTIFEAELLPLIEPLINAALPSPFSKFKFLQASLGKDPMTVGNVAVYKRYKNSVVMDLDIGFIGSPDVQMEVSPITVPFGIKKLRLAGRLTILLCPLTPVLPCIGAAQVTFVSLPNLSIEFSGIASVVEIGPVEKVVHKVLNDVMASTAVLPNRLIFKLSDSVDFFDVYCPPLGVMNVTVKFAEGFEKERKAGIVKLTPDVFVTLELGGDVLKTSVVKKSLSPVWNASHLFLLSDTDQQFKLKAMDWDPISDDLIGQTLVTAGSLLKSQEYWAGLTDDVEAFAANAKILLHTELLIFSSAHIMGQVVVSVIIDRAKGLPVNSRSSHCEVKIGNVLKTTPAIVKPRAPAPFIDPVNPIWNSIYDVVLPDLNQADVVLTVVADNVVVGSYTFQAAEIIDYSLNTKAGEFSISLSGSIRAKVVYRGLVPDCG